jgi:hypothetical protein
VFCAGLQQCFDRSLMARSAIAEHDSLDERGPVQVVDMIERRARFDELAHDAVVSEVRRGNECRAIVAAGDELRAGAEREQHA